MIQLSYQPAFDPFHTVYRMLRLFPILQNHGPLLRDQVRILDYYLLYPHRTHDIRTMPKHRKYKKLAEAYEAAKPYGGEQPDDRTLLERMEPIQIAALQTLAKHGFLDSDDLEVGMVKLLGSPRLAENLQQRIATANKQDAELMEFLATLVIDYPFMGESGLKDRTALLEYRYDAV